MWEHEKAMFKRSWKFKTNVNNLWIKAESLWIEFTPKIARVYKNYKSIWIKAVNKFWKVKESVLRREGAEVTERKIDGRDKQIKINNKWVCKRWIKFKEIVGHSAWSNKPKGQLNLFRTLKSKSDTVLKCQTVVKSQRIDWLHLNFKIEYLHKIKINDQTSVKNLN